MTDPEAQDRWIDAEAAGRILGVSGRTITRWCKRGYVARWRRVGFGANRKHQIASGEIESLRRAFHVEHSDK